MTNLLTHFESDKLLQNRNESGCNVEISVDLGLSTILVAVTEAGIQYGDRLMVIWMDLEIIQQNPNNVFFHNEDGGWERVKAYSSVFERVYSLYPKREAPTMLIYGIPMHRIKDITPWHDSGLKFKAPGSVHGAVLDTSTGLGYTAIWASKTAVSVTSIELDPLVLEICKINPWSAKLFTASNIDQRIGHSWDVIEGFSSGTFSRVIHDPLMITLACELYSTEYYHELHRVMKNAAVLFHYIGDPNSKSGHSTTVGVVKRFERAGFNSIKKRTEAFGVVARKGSCLGNDCKNRP